MSDTERNERIRLWRQLVEGQRTMVHIAERDLAREKEWLAKREGELNRLVEESQQLTINEMQELAF